MSRFLLFVAIAVSVFSASARAENHASEDAVQRGRYITKISGCNDCHTPGFAQSAGKIPESQWLTGDALGFSGPWGTTYAPNLRLRLASMDLATFKTYARSLQTRPPMPYWALNEMSNADLEALYAFVRALGPAGQPAPAALAPGVAAKGPAVQWPAPPPMPAH